MRNEEYYAPDLLLKNFHIGEFSYLLNRPLYGWSYSELENTKVPRTPLHPTPFVQRHFAVTHREQRSSLTSPLQATSSLHLTLTPSKNWTSKKFLSPKVKVKKIACTIRCCRTWWSEIKKIKKKGFWCILYLARICHPAHDSNLHIWCRQTSGLWFSPQRKNEDAHCYIFHYWVEFVLQFQL